MDARQKLQVQAYRIPYHYLPVIEQGRFSQHQYWSWGYRYLGRLQISLELLAKISFQSLFDIGCGDDRFLREVQCRFGGKRLFGINCSEEAVRWARSLNPELKYEVADICQQPLDERFDVVTLGDTSAERFEQKHPQIKPGTFQCILGEIAAFPR